MTQMRRKFLVPALATAIALGLFVFQALPAFACGGLVAPNGDVRSHRVTRRTWWHDAIERYLTSFTYQGDVSNLGLMETPSVNHERLEVVTISPDNL